MPRQVNLHDVGNLPAEWKEATRTFHRPAATPWSLPSRCHRSYSHESLPDLSCWSTATGTTPAHERVVNMEAHAHKVDFSTYCGYPPWSCASRSAPTFPRTSSHKDGWGDNVSLVPCFVLVQGAFLIFSIALPCSGGNARVYVLNAHKASLLPQAKYYSQLFVHNHSPIYHSTVTLFFFCIMAKQIISNIGLSDYHVLVLKSMMLLS